MLGGGEQLAGYHALVAVAETELALVSAGHWDELPAVHAAWDEALASLPPRPPAAAEALLRRALALSEQSEQAITAAREVVMRELGGVAEKRQVGRAYTPALASAPTSRFNLSA